MGTERRTDSYTIIYDWKPELFRKMRLAVIICQMSKKFTIEGLKSIIIFSIFSAAS